MSEIILACDNNECLKKDECERKRLYDSGSKPFKTFNGKPHKGCGKFIQITE